MPRDLDSDIQALVNEERLTEAAKLASDRGAHVAASELYERACVFESAAREALAGKDFQRAVLLAAEAGGAAEAIGDEAIANVEEALLRSLIVSLSSRRRFRHVALLHERLKEPSDAARAWEHTGESVRAARLFEAARQPAEAARVLESALRRHPADYSLTLALGSLLFRYDRARQAVETLQSIPTEAPEYNASRGVLGNALEALGYASAAAEARKAVTSAVPDREETSPASATAKRRIFGRYEWVRDVASTASARVVECIDPIRNEHVAIKILAAYDLRGTGRDALARFEREVQILAKLEHPNIVQLREYIAEGPALVMPWMAGGTLETVLEKERISPARAIEIAAALFRALAHAHRLGVLHRDIKPANVLFNAAGFVQLADFGVGHLGDLSVTATAGWIGTAAYMSPEQREGRPATIASDLYSVGVLLLEMLTRQKPVGMEGSSPTILPSAAHRDLDTRHDRAILSLLATDPKARPCDADEACATLLALPWPIAVKPIGEAPAGLAVTVTTASRRERVRIDESGTAWDTWTARPIVRAPLNVETLARAAAFARAGHPNLQTVLRVDRANHEIWFATSEGEPVFDLTAEQRASLMDAIGELHASGIVHGAVDGAHLRENRRGSVILLFAETAAVSTSNDRDYVALRKIPERTTSSG